MKRNHQAFLDLALPHLDVVWSLARRLAMHPLEPEDLVQDTYLRAFAAFDRYRGGDARAWLVSICLNTARSHARTAKRRPREVPGPDETIASDTDVGAEALSNIGRRAIADALAELPDAQRTAILMMDVSGLTAQQTADILGSPRGTILARVHRGRRKLAQLLRERNEVDDV